MDRAEDLDMFNSTLRTVLAMPLGNSMERYYRGRKSRLRFMRRRIRERMWVKIILIFSFKTSLLEEDLTPNN